LHPPPGGQHGGRRYLPLPVGEHPARRLVAARIPLDLQDGRVAAQDRRLPDPEPDHAALHALLLPGARRPAQRAGPALRQAPCLPRRGQRGPDDAVGPDHRPGLRNRVARVPGRVHRPDRAASRLDRLGLSLRGVGWMKLRIEHRTVYRYEPAVRLVVQTLRLRPSQFEGQRVAEWRIDAGGHPIDDGYVDGAGNCINMLTAHGPVEALEVVSTGVVEVAD